MMGHKQKLIDGHEHDALCHGSRRYYHWKSGKIKSIKRRVNKRFRKDSKREIMTEIDIGGGTSSIGAGSGD